MSVRFDYLDDYITQSQQLPRDALTAQRNAAAAILQTDGLLGVNAESWKYTSSKPFLQTLYQPAGQVKITHAQLAPYQLDSAYRLVIVNGCIDQELSTLPKQLIVCSLSQAEKDYPLIVSAVNQQASDDFAVLNTLLFSEGCFIYLAENTILDKPLHIIHFAKPSAENEVIYSRNIIVLEPQAQGTIVEQFVGEQNYWRNHVSYISVQQNAQLQHYKLQQESMTAKLTDATTVLQQRDAVYVNFNLDLGGALVRHDLSTNLQASGASATLKGIYLTKAKQHVDNHTTIIHSASATHSDEHYKGIMQDQSRAVFNGRVLVTSDVSNINSSQRNDNLLLSDQAEIDTKPELEIYSDDVKCSHGTTVGQLDESALFYLQARGVPADLAKQLLTYGFVYALVEEIPEVQIQKFINQLLTQWFSTNRDLQEVML
jgi:Fe-S cluster assembly protein SufD